MTLGRKSDLGTNLNNSIRYKDNPFPSPTVSSSSVDLDGRSKDDPSGSQVEGQGMDEPHGPRGAPCDEQARVNTRKRTSEEGIDKYIKRLSYKFKRNDFIIIKIKRGGQTDKNSRNGSRTHLSIEVAVIL